MRYLNATQAAIEIGISYRTLRRRIDAGEIEAKKGNDGQYAIALTEVERAKAQQDERPKPAMTGQDRSGQDRFEQQLADLEARVRFLEATTSRDRTLFALPSNDEPEQDRLPLDIPEDAISSDVFIKKYGIKKSVFDGVLRHGLGPDHIQLDRIIRPCGKGRNKHYFTPEQQEAALKLLQQYGRLPEPGE